MSICVLTIRDGRDDIHERSLASLKENIAEPEHHVVIDDRDHKLGFHGAIQAGWEQARTAGADYIIHHEADFLFNSPPPILRMVAVLERNPYLAQICLKRQDVNEQEVAAGGIVECRPDDYRQRVQHGDIFTENRVCFSTNPCVYPAALCHQGWPQESESEGVMTHRLLADPDVRFAFWGAKYDPPMVEHIGTVRAGNGY